MALSSSDRGQTIHMASVKDMIVSHDKVEFIIRERTKSTRKYLKPIVISCVCSSVDSLNISNYVTVYIEKTKEFRKDEKSLFLSWATKRPVVKQTIARWLVQVLKSAGIDTTIFKAHSFRGAGLSHAYQKGASIQEIVKAGNWSNVSTFNRFYNAPCNDSNIGKLILENN